MHRLATFFGAILALSGLAASPQDALKEQLRKKLRDTELAGTWIYDDIKAGHALAKKTGKPLLVVFR